MASREQNVEWHIKFSRIGYLGAPTSTLQGFQDFFHQNVAVFITICMHLQLANHLAQCLRYNFCHWDFVLKYVVKGEKRTLNKGHKSGLFRDHIWTLVPIGTKSRNQDFTASIACLEEVRKSSTLAHSIALSEVNDSGQGWYSVLVSLKSWPGQLLSSYSCRRPKILARTLFCEILSLEVVN